MKVLYIIDSHPNNGGAPISTCSIATEVAKVYSNVSLVLPAQEKTYGISDIVKTIEVKTLKEKFPLFLFHPFKAITLIRELKKEINNIKPDIVHIHMPRAAWAVGILRYMKGIPSNIKLIYTDRDHVETYRWPLRLLSLLLIKSKYNEIVCLTNISSAYWKRKKSKVNIRVIPNSAGERYEKYDSKMHCKIRKRIEIDDKCFTVMFSGRMSIYKNWGLAKEIVRDLKGEDIFFVFAISTMNQEQEASYKEFCEELNLIGAKHVIFHNLSQEDMADLYYTSDIFVLTSDRESFGRTAIEAMSRKCVVIGRDVGGLPEVIGKKENILKCDVGAFSQRILQYKDNIEITRKDKKWFFERFNKNYTVAANTEKHKIMYENYMK